MKISGSQITDAQKCELRFHFAHVMQLRPRSFATDHTTPIGRGIQGHSVLEYFFRALMEGADSKEALAIIEQCTINGALDDGNLFLIRPIYQFALHALEEGWEPIAVEQTSSVDYGNDAEYVFAPDLIYLETKGIRRGTLAMIDYKFTRQAWSDRRITHYKQVPRYIINWNELHPERKVSRGAVVTFNTDDRSRKNLYEFRWLDLNKEKLKRIDHETRVLVQRTIKLKTELQEAGWNQAIRTTDDYACQMCFFAEDLCPMLLRGQDPTKVIKHNYERNDYFDQYDQMTETED